MKVNEGSIDRGVRISAGVVLLGLAVAGIGAPWTWIGVVPLVTGVVGFCPAYSLFGLNTCPADRPR